MVIHERLTMSQMKVVTYIAGTTFFATDAIYLFCCVVLLEGRATKRKDITLAARSIILLPMIPFYFGVAFEERELLFPSIIGALYGVFVDVFIAIMLATMNEARNQYDDALLTALSVCLAVTAMFSVIVVLMILKLTEQCREWEITKQNVSQYALKRFNAIPVSTEMADFIIGEPKEGSSLSDLQRGLNEE